MQISQLIDKINYFLSTLSRERYIKYLRKKGAKIGSNVYFVNPRSTHFDVNRGKFISIGNEVIICAKVSLLAHDYSWTIPMKRFNINLVKGGGKLIIGNNVFIGEGTIILRNVTIGDNVVISAGSVVTKDCEPDSVYAGVPAKKIMTLEQYANRLKENQDDEIMLNYRILSENATPSEREMMNFAFLFLERNEENLNTILSCSWIGSSKERIKKVFLETTPINGVRNYSEFVTYIQNKINNN